MKLSDFFPSGNIEEDTGIVLTHYFDTVTEGTLTFALDEASYRKAVANQAVAAIITYKHLYNRDTKKGIVISESPKRDFFKFHNELFEKKIQHSRVSRIEKNTNISRKAIIKDGVILEEGVIVEDYAIIESGSVLKQGVFVGSHAVIGGRGMHNTFVDDERVWVKDAGGVLLEEGVQVLSHAVVQKPYFHEMTTIGRNSIISVHSNIGHGCEIGCNVMVAGNAQLAGYVKVGDEVWIGPSVTVSHNLSIGNKAKVMLGSTVIRNVDAGEKVSGNFSLRHSFNMKRYSNKIKEIKNLKARYA